MKEPTNILSFPERLQRLKQQSRKEGDPMPTEAELFRFEKDNCGRDIAFRIKTIEEIKLESWATICALFDHTEPLHPEELLNEFQVALRNEMALGRKNVVLYGPPGSGKTTAAMWALRDLHMAGRSVKASRFLQFKIQMEPRFQEETGVSAETVSYRYTEPDFLFLDELGYGDTRQVASDHERRIFFDLVSVRESTGKKTWVCSNTDRETLHELYGEAAFSRLDGTGVCVIGDFGGNNNLRYRK